MGDFEQARDRLRGNSLKERTGDSDVSRKAAEEKTKSVPLPPPDPRPPLYDHPSSEKLRDSQGGQK
jgi:hypothetical protein